MKKSQKRVNRIIKYLQEYIAIYDKQSGYLDYSDETIIDDILYGLGVAFDEKYKFANGYEEFKKRLISHLMQ